jgi:hypothetical protein
MKFTDAEQHAESLNLLRDVRDFLAAWPPHPMRREMLDRINEHLASPTSMLVTSAQHPRVAETGTSVGKRVIQARLVGDELTICRPGEPRDWVNDDLLLLRLSRGEKMLLREEASSLSPVLAP